MKTSSQSEIEDLCKIIKDPEYCLDWVLNQRPTSPPQAQLKIDQAIKMIEQEQEDMRSLPRDEREANMVKYTKIAAICAAISIYLVGGEVRAEVVGA